MKYEDFKNSLPADVVNDKEKFLAVCKAAKVEVPIDERFYVKVHTPNKSRNHPNPKPTEYVVIPHPLGGRDFWVRKKDFGALLDGANKFKDELKL